MRSWQSSFPLCALHLLDDQVPVRPRVFVPRMLSLLRRRPRDTIGRPCLAEVVLRAKESWVRGWARALSRVQFCI